MARKQTTKTAAKKKAPAKTTAKTTAKVTEKKAAVKAEEPKVEEVKAEEPKVEEPKAEAMEEKKTEEPKAEAVEEKKAEEPKAEEPETEEPKAEEYMTPRRSIAFIGSECYPFVKTGGLGDVMYALPQAVVKQNCDLIVILPRYKCIPWEYQEKMVYKGAFEMNLCADGRSFYVGIMEYVWYGVVYDLIDNEEFL